MNNLMTIKNQKAVISFDPEINMFRGEFVGLSGGADFYADNVKDLIREGETSLSIYLEDCEAAGIEPYRQFSGKFNVRIDPELHLEATLLAKASGKSLNDIAVEALTEYQQSHAA